MERPSALPDDLWALVTRWSVTQDATQAPPVAEALIGWLDGRSADALTEMLDCLRAAQAYPISLQVLEAAWHADLPLAQLGRIAEDWLGTVYHGLGDPDGVAEVANFLLPRALKLSPALAGDIGHLLLGWGLFNAAAPLIESASISLKGDMATTFNLGVVRKQQGRWAEARKAFERVLQHHDEQAARWNLGIVCTAVGDWTGARTQWQAIGLPIPPGEGPFRAPPELTPLRLPTGEGTKAPHEVVWASRIGPARAIIEGFPRFPSLANHGDLVLIDGVPTGEINGAPVFPVLLLLKPSNTEVINLAFAGDPAAADAAAERLSEAGFPATRWPQLPTDSTPLLAIACHDKSRLLELLERQPAIDLKPLIQGTA